ncbi:MAG: YkgJ family cysteine cluster protein [Patescibacteria group bacterium]|nr:YkgJ family cysteine cluster protein [Patescibacteria group bacterium]
MGEKFGPCIEKKCSRCCDPVKVARFFPEEKIPIDKEGEKLWQERPELLVSEKHTERPFKAYDCRNFDSETGHCKDYDNRPEICQNTSCIDKNSSLTVDEQHQRVLEEKFISIPTKKKEEK